MTLRAGGQLADQPLINRRLELELELFSGLDAREVGELHAHGDALALFGLDLLSEHLVEQVEISRLPLRRLIEDRVQSRGDEAEAEALQMLDDADGVDFGPEAFVFGDATGQRVASIRTAWEAARERAGLADLHLADLRHEAASRLEDAGVPTTYVSKFLGHRNLSTTTRYLNATIRGLRLAVENLEESRRNAARKSKKSAGLADGLQTEGATRSKRDSRSGESSPPKSLTF